MRRVDYRWTAARATRSRCVGCVAFPDVPAVRVLGAFNEVFEVHRHGVLAVVLIVVEVNDLVYEASDPGVPRGVQWRRKLRNPLLYYVMLLA